MASGLYDPALMKGERTKTAPSKTSSVADQAELYLLYRRNSSILLVGRMIGPHIRIAVSTVHLRLALGAARRILHYFHFVPVGIC